MAWLLLGEEAREHVYNQESRFDIVQLEYWPQTEAFVDFISQYGIHLLGLVYEGKVFSLQASGLGCSTCMIYSISFSNGYCGWL